ncbi:hypothetical protein V8C35DRAFT_302916 [Trichoderma chlorosporum]
MTMWRDIEAAQDAVDRQDQIPGSEEKASQAKSHYKPDLDKSIRPISYANTVDISSASPGNIGSTKLQNTVRGRQSYELQPDSSLPLESAQTDSSTSIRRRQTVRRSVSLGSHTISNARQSERDIPRRADTIEVEADGGHHVESDLNSEGNAVFVDYVRDKPDNEDESIDRFLLEHLRDDIFSINVQQTYVVPFWSFLKSKVFNLEGLIKKNEPRVKMMLSLAALNRMRMRRLQMKLSSRIMRMHYFEEMSNDWETLLVQYIEATHDNDYIRTCVDRKLHDPFLIRSERTVDAAILTTGLLHIPESKWEKELSLTQSVNGKKKINFVPPLERGSNAIGGTRMEMTHQKKTKDFLKRLVFSVIGGAFLVVPMWLMISLNSQRASLITTTVFVFVSGIVASYSLENPLAMVSTTAAYAAVLVVFVGTSSTPTSSQACLLLRQIGTHIITRPFEKVPVGDSDRDNL